jgi:endoglycosylceramidase
LPLAPFAVDDCRVVGEQLGMNQLRLPINWSLLEPTQGNVDQSYIASVLQLAAACAQEGVYTLVDLHQDGWSKFVGDDGAPFWAHQPPLPASAMDQSAGHQPSTSAAVQAAFDGFFGDMALMQAYATTAGQLAAAIDRQPGVVGLEIMNEPLATQSQLSPFYTLVATAVRRAAPGLPLYFEPVAERNIIDFADPDPLGVDDAIYSPHLYTGVFQGSWMVGQDSRIETSITEMLSEATQAHAALMVTEFGNHPTDPVGAAWLTAALTLLDRHAVSASFWVYEEWPSTCGTASCWGLFDEAPDGAMGYTRTLRPAAVTLLARAFPRAIAGHLESFSFDAASRTLTVQLQGASGTHLLAAPTAIYPGQVSVTCDGRAVASTRQGSQVSTECAGRSLVMSPAS